MGYQSSTGWGGEHMVSTPGSRSQSDIGHAAGAVAIASTSSGASEVGNSPAVDADGAQLATLHEDMANAGGKTPTPGHAFQGLPGRPLSRGALPRPETAPSVREAVLEVLLDLERRMRDCESADECRSLVAQMVAGEAGTGTGVVCAGAGAGAGMGVGIGAAGEIPDIPDEESEVHTKSTSLAHGTIRRESIRTQSLQSQASSYPHTNTQAQTQAKSVRRTAFPTSGPVWGMGTANPARALAFGSASEWEMEPTSLGWANHGLVAGWLLGGDEVPHLQIKHVPRSEREVEPSPGAALAPGSANELLDGTQSERPSIEHFASADEGEGAHGEDLDDDEVDNDEVERDGEVDTQDREGYKTGGFVRQTFYPRGLESGAGAGGGGRNSKLLFERRESAVSEAVSAHSMYGDAREGTEED